MLEATEFPSLLKSRLPQGNRVRLYHVSTTPSPCPPLFAPGPGRSEEATSLESHFLTISQFRRQPSDPGDDVSDLLVLGIEVLIFAARDLTTVFVSKADSTGFLTRSAGATSHRTPLAQTVITAFLEFLLQSRRDRGRLVLSLFARSQNQYLFPGSVENVTKHVLDDRHLIKWWCRVLDPLARHARTDALQSVKAHVVVPGCDRGETSAFFPSASRSGTLADPIWSNAYPVSLLVDDTSLPTRCLVPRLPDDPKARFLDDLDAHSRENGAWRGIKTLDQFWEMMSYRQECSAGRLVGFVWVVFTSAPQLTKTNGCANDVIFMQPEQKQKQKQALQQQRALPPVSDSEAAAQLSPAAVQGVSLSTQSDEAPGTSTTVKPAIMRLSVLPEVTVTPAATAASTNPDLSLERTVTGNSHPDLTNITESELSPGTTTNEVTSLVLRQRGEIVLSAEDYQTLMDELLQLDFAGEQIAIKSTKKWREKAIELAGASKFGTDTDGTVIGDEKSDVADSMIKPTVNVLTSIRKKRKLEHVATLNDGRTEHRPTVNVLATDLVRKKPKA